MNWYLLCRLTDDCKAFAVDGCQAKSFDEATFKFTKRNPLNGAFRITKLGRGYGPDGKFYRARRSEQIKQLKEVMGVVK